MLMGSALDMPDKAWRTLAIRWGLFFLAMAIWNEVLWRNFSETTWANWKLGNVGVTFVFIFANMPFIMKHMTPDATDETTSA
jgi:intracellular septation protein